MAMWAKVAIVAAAFFLAWRYVNTKTPIATVDIEDPTVRGSGSDAYGGKDYGVSPVDPEMQRLIDESTRAIEAAGGYPS